ncbi:hypothetical protein H2203_005044 [Taxawa tesnikishii (nom. ined.)]|nr:hypothetical protein H2203_005044 [Dothideales sp. JES 119]
MASVNEQQSASTVASTVIAPPSPLKVHKAGYGVGPEPSKPTGGLNISDKPLFPPRTSSSSTVPDLVKPTGSVFPPEDALPPRPEKARRASRVFHSSMHQLKRMSLTPADMLYPTANIYRTGSNRKAERMLGLSERQSPTIPAPPTELSSLSSYVVKPGPVLPQHHIATAIRPPSDPLNGRIAWFHALTSFLVVFNCWGLNTSFGLFQSYYSHTILANTSPSYIAWIGSTQLALVFLLGVPIGRAVDAGYFRPFFHGGSVLLVLGTFLTAQCRALWSLWLVQGLVTGLGMGCIFCSGVVVLMGWFDERKLGIAMGFAAAGSCLGAIVYTVMAEKLLVRKGFETTMRAMGAMVSYGTDVLHLSQSASVNLLIFMSAANLPGRFLPH